MVQIILIGLRRGRGDGAAVRVGRSGSPLSLLLFYLAPLPILIAGDRLEPSGRADRGGRRRDRARARVRRRRSSSRS